MNVNGTNFNQQPTERPITDKVETQNSDSEKNIFDGALLNISISDEAKENIEKLTKGALVNILTDDEAKENIKDAAGKWVKGTVAATAEEIIKKFPKPTIYQDKPQSEEENPNI